MNKPITPLISVIIPAYNAANTLAKTVESLQWQTIGSWEAIVVDDGSQDGTFEVAKRLGIEDSRLQVIKQENKGVSAARNTGANIARADWLLFLDADDWIAPQYLERMLEKIVDDPTLDLVHCGWVRVTPCGNYVGEKHPSQSPDLFADFASHCPLAMHSCIVRRSIFTEIGGFDPSMLTCEDWDLWQRLARCGKRFGGVPEVMAFYRMRPKSLSGNGKQFFVNGLQVFNRAYVPDPRVSNPNPAYANGLVVHDLKTRRFQWAIWPAGLVLGAGQDVTHLLNLLDGPAPGLDAWWVAKNLFESVLLPKACPPQESLPVWLELSEPIKQFLVDLELASQVSQLAHRSNLILERMILQHIQATELIQMGYHYSVPIEITEPIADIISPAGINRLCSPLTLTGKPLGMVDLPICEGWVSQHVLRDRIASQYAWPILGDFLTASVYRHHSDMTEEQARGEYHDRHGWETFLQQLWDRPDWSEEDFYNVKRREPNASTVKVTENRITLEISKPLPHLKGVGRGVTALVTVAGIPLGEIIVTGKLGRISAAVLRVTILLETGMELCRVVVRETLIGQSWMDGTPLRQRLVQAAQRQAPFLSWVTQELSNPSQVLVLGRRPTPIGSSGSRWATLPTAASETLMTMAKVTQEPIAQIPEAQQPVIRVVYAPNAIAPAGVGTSDALNPSSVLAIKKQTTFNNRDHFETLFASQPDPWKYTTDYEQTKYEQTLQLLPDKPLKNALELACAEGHFTAQLAPKVQSLLATDISEIAVERAARRCALFPHVRFQQLDMAADPLPSALDLIVCSEVLYYIGGWKALNRFAHKVASALTSGGYFLTAHAHLVVDEPERPGYDWDHPFGAKGISDTFSKVSSLHLVQELRTPLYRIQLFQKQTGSRFFNLSWSQPPAPIILEQPQPTPPPSRVAETVLWNGGIPNRQPNIPVTTDRLPILMYHRVAPEGDATMGQWRLTPEAFAEQLRYLRDAGYYSVTLEVWQQAIADRQPLPGRAIVLTFDDGYLDFFTYAFPLLQEYGFSATVFLVAERVGQTNAWDAQYSELVPLMDWEHIRQLQVQGVEFGSHSATHRPLTSLSLTEIVEEGARSRTILTQKLGCPVRTIAYPYGDADPAVTFLMGACGYTAGVTCHTAISQLSDDPLALPRVEIFGTDSLQSFITKLNSGQ
ncbi:MAG: glycosyltransferase [Nodosilinea sp. WJT8-NPBG4]|jgi:glycosyltransferase involved in cell wall biosynthesis/peptidoglycan/xylan/chitin deacetylase (PgdA/CDA1 family)|nr:glycosyltransferase [Nodosilinea sp. WJT8-NPBG4]